MEEKDKNIIKTEIFGTNYTLKTDAEEEYVKQIAKAINERMNAIAEKNPDLPSFKIAVLCLIETMDDMLKTKKNLKEIESELSAKTSELISKIEERLPSDYTIV